MAESKFFPAKRGWLAHLCFLLVLRRERLPQPSRFSKAGHSGQWEQEIPSPEDAGPKIKGSRRRQHRAHPANIAQGGAASVGWVGQRARFLSRYQDECANLTCSRIAWEFCKPARPDV